MSLVRPFGFGGYRSFGPTAQRIVPSPRINLLAGANNSGKSTVLRFLDTQYNTAVQAFQWANSRRGTWKLGGLDAHLGGEGIVEFAVGLEYGGPEHEALLQLGSLSEHTGGRGEELLDALLTLPPLYDSGCLWFTFRATPGIESLVPTFLDEATADQTITDADWNRLQRGLSAGSGRGRAAWVSEVLNKICPKPPQIAVEVVPAIRKIGDKSSEATDFGGSGLIKRLQTHQSPAFTERHLRQRFDQVTHFVRELLEDDTAQLDVPHDLETIVVRHRGRELPLSSLGTGIHEVVIIAVAATLLTNQVVCIEEPELHLHPSLQRRLLRYLAEDTNNQYFITTHSAHLLDTSLGSVHSVRLEDGVTHLRSVEHSQDRFRLCEELGYRASDLVQSTCVIWVEGPSDRIYLNHWLAAVRPELVEGIHYSVMFYGGRLLSHLTGFEGADDFISLVRINRNVALVMDSDASNDDQAINATKQRVFDEVVAGDGMVWVTEGREMENYVPSTLLRETGKHVANGARFPTDIKQFTDVFAYSGKGGPRINKVKLAAALAAKGIPMTELDLAERVGEVAGFIQRANGLGD